jgi:CRP/FNR family transcriptional regulator, cyclic AMP receptor protein
MPEFSAHAFLTTAGIGRTMLSAVKDEILSVQGDEANSVFYVQSGKIKITVVNANGKEAVICILTRGDFFGESCLSGQKSRIHSATAMLPSQVTRIDKIVMLRVLRSEHIFSDMFTAHLLNRNIRFEEDLVDHLFNSSEKRLARILLLTAHFGELEKPDVTIDSIDQESLARMIGTTRSRVSFFMNKWKRLGYIEYNRSTTTINNALLNILLH